MRHVPALLKAGVQAVAAGRKRQFAVVENKKKKKETSPLLQRLRKLNEPFTSSPFSLGEVAKVFYISFTVRKRKRQPIKYLMWKS